MRSQVKREGKKQCNVSSTTSQGNSARSMSSFASPFVGRPRAATEIGPRREGGTTDRRWPCVYPRGGLPPPSSPAGSDSASGRSGEGHFVALFSSQDGFKTTSRRDDNDKTTRRRLARLQEGAKRAQDRNLTPTWPILGSSWTLGRPFRPVFYNVF